MNQLRDLQTRIDMPYVDNSCNLGDIDTKHAGPLAILPKFFGAGRFASSFLGRGARLQLAQKASPDKIHGAVNSH